MNEVWERLTSQARDRVDAALLDRGLLAAIVVLREECGLDPAPSLYEAQEAVTRRRARLIDRGVVEAEPQRVVDISGVLAAAKAITCSVVAVEAVWDGDTQGWTVDLVAIVDRPGRHHDSFDEVRLASIRHGGDLRLFNGQVPPWPEAAEAQQVGEAVAARLRVPFHFTSPQTPDLDLPRWRDGRPASIHQQRYRYVGPADLLAAVTQDAGGHRVTSVDELAAWMAALAPAERREPHTFIVDVAGDLRVAPRRSEHVACAGGRPVLSAGEIGFAGQDRHWAVAEVTNQSTGYCPETSSWQAVAAACERAGLEHPRGFTAAFEFRRCPDCCQINIVKDDDFSCAACGADLPREWNVAR
ncbi:hypothetical protein Cs7R123_44930 [Catellatospora sp. TT07R-123]|uniref:hypothetical protein n=1 Tax=Catellatospora sp. TT07R-123 TaxID=2733863 RepID=UPI001B0CB90D|nr:hypothetical protein [Catellatospora sp. TT07R-123]GHJ47151.1 hypothetical protein Cs7R123_44930 [Catellatospora sp. TT07R-123]